MEASDIVNVALPGSLPPRPPLNDDDEGGISCGGLVDERTGLVLDFFVVVAPPPPPPLLVGLDDMDI